MYIPFFHLSNLISYLGILTSFTSMFFFVQQNITMGMFFFVMSGLADLFDGVFARQFKRTELQRKLGVQVDSLADIINFVMVPVVLVLALDGFNLSVTMFLILFYTLAAIARLSYFNVLMEMADTEKSIEYFVGVPVTYSALVLPLVYCLSMFLFPASSNFFVAAQLGVLALLYIMKVPIPKPRGKAYIFFCILALAVLMTLLLM